MPSVQELNRELVEDSVARITLRAGIHGMKGSGTLISIHQKNYILTNAHVCLSSKIEQILFDDSHDNYFFYEIRSRHEYIAIYVNQSELEYNIAEDWCAIPFDRKFSHPVITHKFISHEMPKQAITYTYNRSEKTKKLYRFEACTTNRTNNFSSVIGHCSEVEIEPAQVLTLSNTKNNPKTINADPHYLYQFPTIVGDSGSPVYDLNYKLVGLVMGISTDKENEERILFSHVTQILSFKDYLK